HQPLSRLVSRAAAARIVPAGVGQGERPQVHRREARRGYAASRPARRRVVVGPLRTGQRLHPGRLLADTDVLLHEPHAADAWRAGVYHWPSETRRMVGEGAGTAGSAEGARRAAGSPDAENATGRVKTGRCGSTIKTAVTSQRNAEWRSTTRAPRWKLCRFRAAT